MPINRRAIIHIGGKKGLKNRQVLKLKTHDNQIFKNVGDKKSISFIVDPNTKQKKTKISNFIQPDEIEKYNIKDEYVKVNKFKYYNDEQMKKKEKEELEAARQKEAKQLKKITESIKQQFSNDKKVKNERKQMGMGTFLQDLKFPIKYYTHINKEFDEFKKEYFLDAEEEEEKFNIFRFKVKNDHKLSSKADMNLQLSNINKHPKEFLSKWQKLNKLSPNDSFIKKIMMINFDQIIVDIDRNLGSFVKTSSKGFHEHDFSQRRDQFWKTPFYFYTAQLALFSQYYFLKHTNQDEWFIDFNGGALVKSDPDGKDIKQSLKKTIYNAVINGKIKGINHSFIKKFTTTKMKIPWENLDHQTTYVQSDLSMFIKFIQSTSNIKKKEFNVIDAAALHTHIYFKQKLRRFFHNNVIIKDKKYCLKWACKMMTFANFIDPYLFTEFWDYINQKWSKFYDQESKKWKDTDNPSIDTIKLGQFHMNHQKYSKFNPMQKWIWSEQKKFNVHRKDEDPFTVTEIIRKIEEMESPNAHHEAFLSVSKNTKTDTLNYHDINDTGRIPAYFDDDRTKMSWWYKFAQICISEWSHSSGILSIEEEFNATNKNSRMYIKYLYKYGIDGCMLLHLIHFKNLRTSINLNKKKHLHNFKDIMITDKYNNTPDIYAPAREKINMVDGFQFIKNKHWNHTMGDLNKDLTLQLLSQGLDSGFYLSGRSPTVPYDLKKNLDEQQANINASERQTLVIDTPNNSYWNKYLNPLTCNLEETYVKHFDYCIEQIEKQHGSFKNFNKKFDQLFSSSLILYKNGFMDDHRLTEINKNNPGITIVNKITDIWDKYKDDERIYFPKRDGMDDDVLSRIEGWLGKFENNTVQHALDGIYHIDYNSFMKNAANLLVPFVPVSLIRKKNLNIFSKDFEWSDSNSILYDSEKTKLLWPRNSGRPFIFINKYKFLYTDGKKVGDNGKLKIKKKIYKTNEIADKIKNATLIGTTKDKKIGKTIPDYWFDREYPFTNKDIITHIKLKTLLDSGYDKYKIIVKDINKKLKEGGIIESLPEEVKDPIPETEEPEDDGRELVNPGDYEEKRRELAGKTSEEEEEAERAAESLGRKEITEQEQIAADRLAQTTQEQLTDAQETSVEIDALEGNIDKRIKNPQCEEVEQENPKLAFVKNLLTKNPEITNEEIKQEFKNHSKYASTMDMAIDCIITAAKGWLKNPDDDDRKVSAHEEPEQDPKKEEVERQLREIYKLKIDKIPEDGDCLFEAFHRFLISQKPPIKVPSVAEIRIEIASHVQTNWVTLSGFVDTELYKGPEDYFKKMISMEPDGSAPRARFGSELEMKAFEEIYKAFNFKVQVLKWQNESQQLDELRNFKKDKINDPKTLTIYNTGDLHYEYLLPINTQAGGGNNVYINKCKNHRHKRTRKFRIRFKNIGDWVHLNKPKKKTRRKY